MTVLVYGAMNPDIVHEVEQVPRPGDDIRSVSWSVTWGGKAANAAVALSGWGVPTRLLGLVIGRDPLGDALLAALDRPHLDLRWIQRSTDQATGHCIILRTPDGDRTIICTGYEEATWPAVPDTAWDGVDAVLLDGFGGAGAAATAAEARRRAIPTVWLDAPTPLPTSVDLVVWSRHEHTEAEAARLAVDGPGVVLTAGPDPIIAWWNGRRHEVRPPSVEVVDATGAGDAFAAGCAFALTSGSGPVETVTWAAAAGAAYAASGRAGVPDRDTVAALRRTIASDQPPS